VRLIGKLVGIFVAVKNGGALLEVLGFDPGTATGIVGAMIGLGAAFLLVRYVLWPIPAFRPVIR
jgi:hypothetical protein